MRLVQIDLPSSEALSLDFLIGRQLRSVDASATPTWVFHFGNGVVLSATTLWRVVADGRIVITDGDHLQWFGLAAPLDAVVELTRALAQRRIQAASFDSETGDLRLVLDDAVRFEVINSSGGYDSWMLHKPDGSVLVGLGGGQVAYYVIAATD